MNPDTVKDTVIRYSTTLYTQTFSFEFLSSIGRERQNVGINKAGHSCISLVAVSPMFPTHKGQGALYSCEPDRSPSRLNCSARQTCNLNSKVQGTVPGSF